jgi:hypothetical protein
VSRPWNLLRGVVLGCVIAVGLAGCGGHAALPRGATASRQDVEGVQHPQVRHAQVRDDLAAPDARTLARDAAERFDRLYFAGKFAIAWKLLAPGARHLVSRGLWVQVHDSCLAGSAGGSRAITAVTVFGNAAIVTATMPGVAHKSGLAEEVFNYSGGRWGFSPEYMAIYRQGSLAADIAAAKAAGVCGRWTTF